MNNYSDVYATTAVTGGLRHAQAGPGLVDASMGAVIAPPSWLTTCNDAVRLVARNAAPANAAFMAATAKQAPQSRGSSAHT